MMSWIVELPSPICIWEFDHSLQEGAVPTCGEGRELGSPLCAVCATDTHVQLGEDCAECPGVLFTIAVTAVAGAAALLFVLVVLHQGTKRRHGTRGGEYRAKTRRTKSRRTKRRCARPATRCGHS